MFFMTPEWVPWGPSSSRCTRLGGGRDPRRTQGRPQDGVLSRKVNVCLGPTEEGSALNGAPKGSSKTGNFHRRWDLNPALS